MMKQKAINLSTEEICRSLQCTQPTHILALDCKTVKCFEDIFSITTMLYTIHNFILKILLLTSSTRKKVNDIKHLGKLKSKIFMKNIN